MNAVYLHTFRRELKSAFLQSTNQLILQLTRVVFGVDQLERFSQIS